MSRYIDAEKELTELKAMKVEGETFTTAVNFAIITLEEAPSIDIVFCRECKRYDDEDYGEPTRYCTWHESVVFAEDFCSYGERKESE